MDENIQKINSVTWKGLAVNIVLTGFKFVAGILGNSGAIIADAVHSLSDSLTDLVLLWGVRAARKPADKTHAYGHGKIETFVSTVIGFILLLIGGKIFWGGVCDVFRFVQGDLLPIPGRIALIAAFVSIPLKEWLYRKSLRVAKETGSKALLANAWHHRTDALSSLGVMMGVGGAILIGEDGAILDPIAALIVSFIIMNIAIKIVLESSKELTDASLGEAIEKEILEIALSVEGIQRPHKLRTRKVGKNVAIEFHVKVNPDLNIKQAHDMATQVELLIKERFGRETFISVHVEPV